MHHVPARRTPWHEPGTPIQVHHVGALANAGRSPFVEWLASARSCKTLYLCIHCHRLVHTKAGQNGVSYTAESRMPGVELMNTATLLTVVPDPSTCCAAGITAGV